MTPLPFLSRSPLRFRHFVPLLGFVVPTAGIGYGVVIPRSCIAGWNELTIGFAVTILSASLTYCLGLRAVARECSEAGAKR